MAQGVEAQMAEPAMPQPWLFRARRRETHRLLHLQVQKIKPVTEKRYLGEETQFPVSDQQHSVTDQHLRASLVQLPEADDAGAQLRN